MNEEPNPTSQHSRTRTPLPQVRRDFPWRPATPCSDLEEDPSEPENWEEEEEVEEEIEISPPLSPLKDMDVEEDDLEDALDLESLEIPADIWDAAGMEEELNLDSIIIPPEEVEAELEISPFEDEMEVEDELETTPTRESDSKNDCIINSHTGWMSNDSTTADLPTLKMRGYGLDIKPRKRRSIKSKSKPPKTTPKKRGRGPDKKPKKKRGSRIHPPVPPPSPGDEPRHDIIEISTDDENSPPLPPLLRLPPIRRTRVS